MAGSQGKPSPEAPSWRELSDRRSHAVAQARGEPARREAEAEEEAEAAAAARRLKSLRRRLDRALGEVWQRCGKRFQRCVRGMRDEV